jgi:hypothetical protein
LEAAFGLFSGEDKNGDELRCYLDLAAGEEDRGRDTKLFVTFSGKKTTADRVRKGDPTLIEVKTFYGGEVDYETRDATKAALKSLKGWHPKRVEQAMHRFDNGYKMLNQPVPCTTVSDVSDDQAVEIFRRLNKGGTSLREGDVRAAELARGSAVTVLKRMREFVTEERPRRLGFGFSFAFRALVVFHQGSAQFKALRPDWVNTPGANGRALSESWTVTERALDRAFRFIDEKMKWSSRALVPSNNAIIVLAYALERFDSSARTAGSVQAYRRWLVLTALRGVFQGSVETTINRYVRAVRDSRTKPAAALTKALIHDNPLADQPSHAISKLL